MSSYAVAQLYPATKIKSVLLNKARISDETMQHFLRTGMLSELHSLE